jgi:hypothetical protein
MMMRLPSVLVPFLSRIIHITDIEYVMFIFFSRGTIRLATPFRGGAW